MGDLPVYNPWAPPIFPEGAAFGVGSPAETSQQPAGLLNFIGGLYNSLGGIAKSALGNSANAVSTGTYNPAPTLEAAMLPMGTGAIAGVPMRGAETVLGAGPIRKLTGGVGDPTQTGWVFRDVAQPPMQRGDWRKVTAATDTGEGIQNVELPIRSMYATQKTVNPDFAKPLSNNHELPFVLKKDGRYFVQDGHHRITAASEGGSETAKVRMVDLDGTTQTSFPLIDIMRKYAAAGMLGPPIFASAMDNKQ